MTMSYSRYKTYRATAIIFAAITFVTELAMGGWFVAAVSVAVLVGVSTLAMQDRVDRVRFNRAFEAELARDMHDLFGDDDEKTP